MERKTDVKETNQQRIARIHDETGLSFDKLAKITGFNRNTLAAWAKGRRNPNDIVTNTFVERIQIHLTGVCEYINKTANREQFQQDIQKIVQKSNLTSAIMAAFDSIPTMVIENDQGYKNEELKVDGKDENQA